MENRLGKIEKRTKILNVVGSTYMQKKVNLFFFPNNWITLVWDAIADSVLLSAQLDWFNNSKKFFLFLSFPKTWAVSSACSNQWRALLESLPPTLWSMTKQHLDCITHRVNTMNVLYRSADVMARHMARDILLPCRGELETGALRQLWTMLCCMLASVCVQLPPHPHTPLSQTKMWIFSHIVSAFRALISS